MAEAREAMPDLDDAWDNVTEELSVALLQAHYSDSNYSEAAAVMVAIRKAVRAELAEMLGRTQADCR